MVRDRAQPPGGEPSHSDELLERNALWEGGELAETYLSGL